MRPTRSVVVVDDDIDHALIARVVLGQVAREADVTVCTDPHAIAERLGAAPLGALVLIDMNLDGLDGTKLIAVVHRDRPDLRLVLLSAVMSDRTRTAAIASGAESAWEKPATIAAWSELLAALLLGNPAGVETHAA